MQIKNHLVYGQHHSKNAAKTGNKQFKIRFYRKIFFQFFLICDPVKTDKTTILQG